MKHEAYTESMNDKEKDWEGILTHVLPQDWDAAVARHLREFPPYEPSPETDSYGYMVFKLRQIFHMANDITASEEAALTTISRLAVEALDAAGEES